MKKFIQIALVVMSFETYGRPIISGISTNEINIDTEFKGAKILLFGAKGDFGNILVAVRGPKKNFMVTKKENLLGVWYNGERIKFDSYSFYSTFSSLENPSFTGQLFSDIEIGKHNLKLQNQKYDEKTQNEFKVELINELEDKKLYANSVGAIEFLDETLFKIILNFPKNIMRGVYTVEIYLINDDNLVSFQSIPIYVNQVGFSAEILDFAYHESFLYGLLAVVLALFIGWLANYVFARFIGK
jgi:uncharacterized protein (TIGR02186 family)